jgi:hypothetical protein
MDDRRVEQLEVPLPVTRIPPVDGCGKGMSVLVGHSRPSLPSANPHPRRRRARPGPAEVRVSRRVGGGVTKGLSTGGRWSNMGAELGFSHSVAVRS